MKTLEQILSPIKADFEGWYEKTYRKNPKYAMGVLMSVFYLENPDFQVGVLLHYFRERWGMHIYFSPPDTGEPLANYSIWRNGKAIEGRYWTYTIIETAFLSAVEKAVELIK